MSSVYFFFFITPCTYPLNSLFSLYPSTSLAGLSSRCTSSSHSSRACTTRGETVCGRDRDHVPPCREKHWMGSPDTKHNRVYGRQIGSCRYTTALFLSIPFRDGDSGGVPHRYRAPTVHADTYVRVTLDVRGLPPPTLMREREKGGKKEKRDENSSKFIRLLI